MGNKLERRTNEEREVDGGEERRMEGELVRLRTAATIWREWERRKREREKGRGSGNIPSGKHPF
jgi:hypothetical protein